MTPRIRGVNVLVLMHTDYAPSKVPAGVMGETQHTPHEHTARLRVALVEDDPEQARLVALWLEQDGLMVSHYPNGKAFLRAVAKESYDLVVLDRRLPDVDGVDVLTLFRSMAGDGPAVMMVSSDDDEPTVVTALSTGTNDFMYKPLRHQEFLARIHALGRRSAMRPLQQIDPFAVDEPSRAILLQNEPIPLTGREFDMAMFLFRRRGQLVSRNHILESIWGSDQLLLSRTVDTHISRLRKKLHLDGAHGWRLVSVYRRGYCLQRVT